MEIQGHRGTRGLRPENTLSSFSAAIDAGVDALELDLLMTKDGELVIYHDFYVNEELCTYLDGTQITSPPPLIYSLTLAALKQFDCGSKKNPLFPRQKLIPKETIPTLKQLFSMISSSSHPNAKKVCLNLEIKGDPTAPELTADPESFVRKLLDVVNGSGFKQRVYYSSFDPRMLEEVHKLDPNATLAFLKEGDLEGLVEMASQIGAAIVSPEHDFLKNREDVKFLQEHGFKVIAWTVNDPNRCIELAQMGVDGIITDYPQDMIQLLGEKKPPP